MKAHLALGEGSTALGPQLQEYLGDSLLFYLAQVAVLPISCHYVRPGTNGRIYSKFDSEPHTPWGRFLEREHVLPLQRRSAITHVTIHMWPLHPSSANDD